MTPSNGDIEITDEMVQRLARHLHAMDPAAPEVRKARGPIHVGHRHLGWRELDAAQKGAYRGLARTALNIAVYGSLNTPGTAE